MKSHCTVKANDRCWNMVGGNPLLEAISLSKTSGNVEGVLIEQGWDSFMQWTLSVYKIWKPIFEPALWACGRHVEPNCSNLEQAERNKEWESARNALTCFKGPKKNHIQAVPSMSFHPLPRGQAGACAGVHPSQGCHSHFALTHLLPGTFGLSLCYCQAFTLKKAGVPSLGGCHTSDFTGFLFHRLQTPYSLL